MPNYNITYKRYSECSILIEWPNKIAPEILDDILIFKNKIETELITKINYTSSAYNSLLISYKNDSQIDLKELKELYTTKNTSGKHIPKTWKIPVCYDLSFGIDLLEMSELKKLKTQEIIHLHHKPKYLIYTIGFLPGFLYLGGLNNKLKTPRRSSPRLKINKGDVAIGENQTGVYPSDSPGGWNIIGNSPIDFFNINKKKPCFAKPGDYIHFYPVTKSEHELIKIQIESGLYNIKFEI